MTEANNHETEELEQDANEEELDDEIVEALKILESDEYLELPAKSEIHEWNIMRQFCNSIEDARLRRSLLDAIHGAGAFGLFRHLIDEHDITEDWYAFRQSALESIAVGWLEANKIPYTRGKPQAGTLATDDD